MVGRELLTNAVTVNSLAQNVSRVVGPPLAGAIIAAFGNASVFIVLAVLNVVAMGLTMLIRMQKQAAGRPSVSMLASLTEGIRFSYQNRLMLALVLGTAITPIIVYPYVQFLPVFAQDVLHGGPQTYGLLASGLGWGSLVGLSVLALLGDVRNKGKIFVGSHIVYVVFVIAFAYSESVVLSMACLIAAGVFHSVMTVMANTMPFVGRG